MVADISSCPLEILHLIAAAIDSEDLVSLRLVSKQWCDLSSKLFGLAKLQHLRLISSPYSLQSLVDLTAHPVLGPCVQFFEVGTYRLKKHLVNTQPHVEASRANVAALTQFRFQQSGLHIVLLTEALKNLSRHGVVPKTGLFEDVIRATSGQEHHRRGYGYHELYGSIDIASCGGSRATQTLLDLMTAIKRSGCPTSGISIDLQWNSLAQQAISRHPGLDQLIEKMIMPDTDKTEPGWNMAVKLTDACDEGVSNIAELHDQGKSLRLTHISLEIYEITDMPQFDRGAYGSLVDILHYPSHLQRVSLDCCFIDTSIFELLMFNIDNLRHLSMSATTFHDDSLEDGIDFLKTIKIHLTLESITLNKLFFENKHSRILVVDEEVESKGSEQIISLMDDLIGTVNAANVKLGRIGNDEQSFDIQI
ncbi:unnamed protein product [Aureobasidium uvarum]|uniref:F-box domain-containing protein n=1 Tax=Aureobasidium uvarum TaxID=2773716 RepID=A0A9N8KAI8_9PEZI|nr:unnamed protein product [Aureobasidium uvarum]